MDIKSLRDTIEDLKKDLGEGLLSMDIYGRADGQSLAGFNSNPKACALFNKVTGNIESALKGAKFPELDRYYMLDLVDEKMVLIVPAGDYQWNMLLDKTQIQLGLMLNIALPKIMEKNIGGPAESKSKVDTKTESKAKTSPEAETITEPDLEPASKSDDDLMPEELSEADKVAETPTEPDTAGGRCTIDFS